MAASSLLQRAGVREPFGPLLGGFDLFVHPNKIEVLYSLIVRKNVQK